jgi:integrase/recombinase XerD
LILEKIISENPSDLLENPKTGKKLPEFLSIEEIDLLVNQIDRSKPDGERNLAIIEVLYGCGLRVSELLQLKIYLNEVRIHQKVDKEFVDHVFINKNGGNLSRIMIFKIIKKLTKQSGISKNVSPHTLRHSFATHLVEGGADLRAVQEMLGHESITTTEIYTHLDKNYLKQTILDHHPIEKTKMGW